MKRNRQQIDAKLPPLTGHIIVPVWFDRHDLIRWHTPLVAELSAENEGERLTGLLATYAPFVREWRLEMPLVNGETLHIHSADDLAQFGDDPPPYQIVSLVVDAIRPMVDANFLGRPLSPPSSDTSTADTDRPQSSTSRQAVSTTQVAEQQGA